MKIEVDEFYKFVSEKSESFKAGNIVIVRKAESGFVEVEKFGRERTIHEVTFDFFEKNFKKIEMASLGESVNAVFDSVRKVVYSNAEHIEEESSKPAHYDTDIDPIMFAKANFSREAVQGFMRISAIKYLQRDKGQTLSDLKKAADFVRMLIEMEEEE